MIKFHGEFPSPRLLLATSHCRVQPLSTPILHLFVPVLSLAHHLSGCALAGDIHRGPLQPANNVVNISGSGGYGECEYYRLVFDLALVPGAVTAVRCTKWAMRRLAKLRWPANSERLWVHGSVRIQNAPPACRRTRLCASSRIRPHCAQNAAYLQ
ncbi:hypothetical protein V8D89_009882 [Ganoderma adspersum]